MFLTDQPGRLFAILIFAPYVIYRGLSYRDNLLLILGVGLFLYELFWLLARPPQVAYIPYSAEN